MGIIWNAGDVKLSVFGTETCSISSSGMVRASLLAVRMLLTGTRTEIAYEKLRGLPRSFAHEAGQNALAGTVPERSKDDGFEVATFAGGCFWGTELHFMRVPGVKSTCVGYTKYMPTMVFESTDAGKSDPSSTDVLRP